jgi:hypothetical protein
MGTGPDRESKAIDDLRRYARHLADSVSPGRTEVLVARVLSARRGRQRSRRLILVLATAVILAVSNVGLATVADSAIPGDFLYPFDRGYEWARDLFGASDRTLERLQESTELNERGETGRAIEFLQELLSTSPWDRAQVVKAIQALENQAARANESQGGAPASPPSTPAVTVPGQVDDHGNSQDPASPSVTAPGRTEGDVVGDSPSDTAPGQNKEASAKANPPDISEGRGKSSEQRNGGQANTQP